MALKGSKHHLGTNQCIFEANLFTRVNNFNSFLGDVAFHRRITMPTLLVYGLKDGFVSLVEMCEMERTIPKSYLELIPLAGHHVMQDQPKELNTMIKKFIEKYQPSKS